MLIQPIRLPAAGLDVLQSEARAEGYRFLDSLADEWASGANRFDGPGETLCGYLDQAFLVAIGGLNRDPFAYDPKLGRIRRVYVRVDWRNRGVGTAILKTLIAEARKNFHSVRLRAENPKAAQLYERLGFIATPSPDATHSMQLY